MYEEVKENVERSLGEIQVGRLGCGTQEETEGCHSCKLVGVEG